MSRVSCWLFLVSRAISSEMSTAESSWTYRSSSIFVWSSAIGCSKSRKVCFNAGVGKMRERRPLYRTARRRGAGAPGGESLVGEHGAQHDGTAEEGRRARVLAHED